MATYPLPESYIDGDVLTAAAYNGTNEGVNDIAFGVLNAQTGTAYTLALTDIAKIVTLNNASPITMTIPANNTVAFPIGTQIVVAQLGAGAVALSAAGGVTLNAFGATTKTSGQYAVASLLKTDTNTWLAFGNLTS